MLFCAHMQSNISGPLVLCSRSDSDQARFFDGSIAQLGEQNRLDPAACGMLEKGILYEPSILSAARTSKNLFARERE